jgi:hypothetical protein
LLVVSDEVEVQIIYTVLYTPSKSVVQILRWWSAAYFPVDSELSTPNRDIRHLKTMDVSTEFCRVLWLSNPTVQFDF